MYVCQYEHKRKRNPHIISGVYDCSEWQRKLGPIELRDLCLVLLFCIDAIQAFKKQGQSLMPAEFQILSLPPQFRTKLKFMLLVMLIPATLKAFQQKKYFDYLAEELNDLATTGLRGPRGTINVRVFGITLDLPGRDKFLQLRGICINRQHQHSLFNNHHLLLHGRRIYFGSWLP